jgi:serine/threonine protein kinase
MAICRTLKHPNIQTALDAGETRSALYLVLEYVNGTSLREILEQRGRLEPAEAAGYALQLLAALDYAHAQRVYHRDLKPGNVLVSVDGQLKIIDFGIAYMAHTRRLTWQWAGSTLGTPCYMSPEQVQGKRGDARSDIYALGAMLYEMLTGRPPFDGSDIFAIMQQHLKVTPQPPDRLNRVVPPGLSGIVLKALRKNPDERYQSAAEMIADVERFDSLRLEDFQLGAEAELDTAHPNRLLALLAASLAAGFIGVSSAAVVIAHIASRR